MKKRMGDLSFAVVGVGLMGSAFAQGLKKIGAKKVYGIDTDQKKLEEAKQRDIIDEGSPDPRDVLPHADVVFLCLYLSKSIDFMKEYGDAFKEGALLTDIVGVKEAIIEAAKNHLPDKVTFIPGHPMTGRELSKEPFTSSKIFQGKNYILTPLESNKEKTVSFLEEIISQLGFAEVVKTDPKTHDQKIAFTSQLCHIIAASMVDAGEDLDVKRFGGGSYQDMTRIAIINKTMWPELFVANKEALLPVLEDFMESISFFKEQIEADRESEMVKKLDEIGAKRKKLEE